MLPLLADGAGLFPQAGEVSRPGRRRARACVQAAVVVAAAVVLLGRVALVPAWNCLYAEDYGIFLVQALAHPWHLLVPYNGYLQFLSRVLAQAVSLSPLTWAAFGYAVTGALIAGGCALFTYHASAGHIASPALRAVLAAALILLPVAPLELAANGVNSVWYLIVALFWAALWRPSSRAGQGTSALIAFAVVTSSPLALAFAPLLALRAFALPRGGRHWVREHAVTIGWLLGWPAQLYAIGQSYASHTQRTGPLAPLGRSVAFYLHTVVLRAFGWHVSWDLVRAFGTSGATLLCGASLVLLLGLAALAGRARAFVVLAAVFGFAFTVVTATLTSVVDYQAPLIRPVSFEPASRYSVLPLMLLYAALIAGADSFASQYGELGEAGRAVLHGVVPAVLRFRFGSLLRRPLARPAAVLGVALVPLCVLGPGWVADYSYPTQRTSNGPWRPIAVRYLDRCRDRPAIRLPEWSGHHTLVYPRVPCSRLIR